MTHDKEAAILAAVEKYIFDARVQWHEIQQDHEAIQTPALKEKVQKLVDLCEGAAINARSLKVEVGRRPF